jgi:hypothetical protein
MKDTILGLLGVMGIIAVFGFVTYLFEMSPRGQRVEANYAAIYGQE